MFDTLSFSICGRAIAPRHCYCNCDVFNYPAGSRFCAIAIFITSSSSIAISATQGRRRRGRRRRRRRDKTKLLFHINPNELPTGLAHLGPCSIAHIKVTTVIGLVFKNTSEYHRNTTFADGSVLGRKAFAAETECDVYACRATVERDKR
jgi:hypothetical protein